MMNNFEADDRARIRRRFTEQAISLAMESRWEEAVKANRAIIALYPNDVEAYNRLGKALTELGKYSEAREAYTRALGTDPNNSIARKNLQRLATLKELEHTAGGEVREKVDPDIFVEEIGKTGVTQLEQVRAGPVLAKMTAGDRVYLKLEGKTLRVENSRSEYLGRVEPRLGLRLARLIEGGNRYEAAITSINDGEVKIIIKEVYQHPNLVGKPSFPPKEIEAFRPYTKESLLRYELEEEELLESSEYPTELGEEIEAEREGMSYYEEEIAPEEAGEEELEE